MFRDFLVLQIAFEKVFQRTPGPQVQQLQVPSQKVFGAVGNGISEALLGFFFKISKRI